MPTKAQIEALKVMRNGPITEDRLKKTGLRTAMLRRMAEDGLVKFYPYSGAGAAWKIKGAGRVALRAAGVDG